MIRPECRRRLGALRHPGAQGAPWATGAIQPKWRPGWWRWSAVQKWPAARNP